MEKKRLEEQSLVDKLSSSIILACNHQMGYTRSHPNSISFDGTFLEIIRHMRVSIPMEKDEFQKWSCENIGPVILTDHPDIVMFNFYYFGHNAAIQANRSNSGKDYRIYFTNKILQEKWSAKTN